MKSYVATNLGWRGRVNEIRNLYRGHTRGVENRVYRLLEEARECDAKVRSILGAPVAGLKMLEIGPGQQLVQLAYFGTQNEVVGIDLDVILQRLNLRGCLRMIRQNGWVRTCKT